MATAMRWAGRYMGMRLWGPAPLLLLAALNAGSAFGSLTYPSALLDMDVFRASGRALIAGESPYGVTETNNLNAPLPALLPRRGGGARPPMDACVLVFCIPDRIHDLAAHPRPPVPFHGGPDSPCLGHGAIRGLDHDIVAMLASRHLDEQVLGGNQRSGCDASTLRPAWYRLPP